MKIKYLAITGATAALMACSPSLQLPEETVTYQKTAGFNSATLVSNHATTFRTRQSGQGVGTEVAANCSLVGSGFGASFNTPSKVLLPDFGPSQGPIKVTCTQAGQTTAQTIPGINLSRKLRDDNTRNNAASQGLLVAIVSEAITAAVSSDKPGDSWGYPDTTIHFDAETVTSN